ncbi:chitobiosyldiphosphodolichol beta-mannosyltransferase-like isoform X2 [Stegodyphus dumicola]|uniref:chitobiosyldiphosphodolichol beta-mannosyltransferase-like isoform X2 n=1 Tax=Stegodyphus dumicola TaxID=202533 RepID=UPI0015AFB5DF|nr:chitobiosyldiphosphodolichol beta-mannosyltransferase-like isoform X2 [Stegodyphus dumicola]
MKSEFVNNTEKKCVSVVVLGDFGRSPRMQYHTLSLSKNNFRVDVVAYKGAEPHKRIINDQNVSFHYMKNIPQWIEYSPGLFRYILKTVWQSFFLFWTLINISKINHIFLQNPPAVPTLPVICFVCWLRNCCLVIDFHNYGYTILGLSAGKESFLVKIAKWCERYFSLKACRSICVTKAMKEDLMQNWNVRASVFYDCAPDIFHPISEEEKHKFFMRLGEDYGQFRAIPSNSNGEEATRFTKKEGDKYEVLNNRPALIVSSTSWTEDEDFSILLSALEDYEEASKQMKDLPDLLVAITGKGPLKSYYERLIEDKGFSHVEVMTLWLQSEDYPTFLACADLGVSLHNSSSGFDLPMKVVDMFGCCLPVCAFEFQCLHELVKDGVFGKIFSNSRQLSLQFQILINNLII